MVKYNPTVFLVSTYLLCYNGRIKVGDWMIPP